MIFDINLYNILSATALMLSIVGNLLINNKIRFGYVIWITSNTSWIIVNLLSPETNWFQTAMFAIFIALNVHGLFKWRLLSKNKNDSEDN